MKKLLAASLLLSLLVCLGTVALSAPGDETDPVVSRSYLNSVLLPQLQAEFSRLSRQSLTTTYQENFLEACQLIGEYNLTLAQESNDRWIQETLLLKQDDTLTMLPGAQVTLLSGQSITDTGALVDVTHGQAVPHGAALSKSTLYMKGDSRIGGIRIASETAEVLVRGVVRLNPSSRVNYGSLADALNTMGLFLGTGSSYDLQSAATRVQGLVMFLRILGEEDEALAFEGTHPFRDVPISHWAYRHVAYAYHRGYTTGTSATAFSPNLSITAQQYTTFLMRALHYEEGTVFSYNTVLQDAVDQGLFTQAEIAQLSPGLFIRAEMVYLSYYGLFGLDQQADALLLQRLVADGTLTESDLYAGICKVHGRRLS